MFPVPQLRLKGYNEMGPGRLSDWRIELADRELFINCITTASQMASFHYDTVSAINSYIINRQYCKFGNFRENCILANSVKRHICNV